MKLHIVRNSYVEETLCLLKKQPVDILMHLIVIWSVYMEGIRIDET
jgi:hypothetical protein